VQLIRRFNPHGSRYSVLAILFNCSEPEALTMALECIHADTKLRELLKQSKILLGAYANRLTAVDPNWTLADSVAPQPLRKDLDEKQYWEDFAAKWTSQLGVQLVGGNCGITPEHIAYLNAELSKRNQLQCTKYL
jgi:S-methylmethionine-dependent homocysteine/selenocysteine methylase